jgi:hypothetical protein
MKKKTEKKVARDPGKTENGKENENEKNETVSKKRS